VLVEVQLVSDQILFLGQLALAVAELVEMALQIRLQTEKVVDLVVVAVLEFM
jgi:hypothetical protein